MTDHPKAARYFIRRSDRPAGLDRSGYGSTPDAGHEGFENKQASRDQGLASPPLQDGMNIQTGLTQQADPGVRTDEVVPERGQFTNSSTIGLQQPASEPSNSYESGAVPVSPVSERLSRRQLRRAIKIAEFHGMKPISQLDAVRLLREAGIDPFSLASMVRYASAGEHSSSSPTSGEPPRASGHSLIRLPGDNVKLPRQSKNAAPKSSEPPAEVNHAAEISSMQTELVRRRRRRLALFYGRILLFVLLPTLVMGWYFFMVATPIYSVRSEFTILKAGPSSSNDSLGGLFSGTGLAKSQDSTSVEGYLKSREAMERLERDSGFHTHFQNPEIDPLQRLPLDASLEEVYRFYQKFVVIEFDTRDELIRMDVMATDPEVAADWSRQLIKYAEGQVDHMTLRLREDQMRDAQAGYEAAQEALIISQRTLIGLQEKFKVISTETEVGLIIGQVSGLESQITQERLALAQMEANSKPNQARMDPIKQRIASLEGEVAKLRKRMTEDPGATKSLAEIQGELQVAQANMQSRQMLLAKAIQSMETSRIEASRQVRYLSVSVNPIPPDEPSYPRAFVNTLVSMLILLGIYAVVSISAAIWREQISS